MDAIDAAESGSRPPSKNDADGKRWIEALSEAKQREHAWLLDAEKAESQYLMRAPGKSIEGELPRYNILHSNVATIIPNIISSMPKPEIRPRHNREDPASRLVADVLEAGIATQIDDGRLDRVLEKVAQDAYVTGRGIMRAEFAADVIELAEGGRGVTNERIRYRNISWKNYREGPATKWSEVPWVAFRHIVSLEEMERLGGKSVPVGGPITPTAGSEDRPNERDDLAIWEIWERETRKIWFVRDADESVLKCVEDPLKLRGFFPMPEPLQPITGTSSRTPTCPFRIYEDLSDELNVISTRIYNIMQGLKVRGFVINVNGDDMTELADAKDNEIVPLRNLENVMQMGGLDKAFWMMPIEQAAGVLKELYQQREMVQASIYEITGISDIMRGDSDSQETAAAQNLKSEFGAMRLSQMQRQIQSAARDIFVISAEILSNNFTTETLARVSGLQIPRDAAFGRPLDHYLIDVETDSTIMGDRRKFQQEFTDMANGVGLFIDKIGVLGQMFPEVAEELVGLLGVVLKHANIGREGEQIVRRLIDKASQGLAAQRQQQQQAAEQQEAAAKAALPEKQIEQERLNREMADTQKKDQLAFDRDRHEDEMKLKREELDVKREDLRLRAIELGVKSMLEKRKIDGDEEARDTEMANANANAQLDREADERKSDKDRDSADRKADRDRESDDANRGADRLQKAVEGSESRDAAATEGDRNRAAAAREGDKERASREREGQRSRESAERQGDKDRDAAKEKGDG